MTPEPQARSRVLKIASGERRRLTLEALADVAAKRTRDHAGIEAWARALGKPKRRRPRLTDGIVRDTLEKTRR
jgi:hypothetical protein